MGMLTDNEERMAMLRPGEPAWAEQNLKAYLAQQPSPAAPQAAPAAAQQGNPAMAFAQQYRQMMQQAGMLPTAAMPQPSPEDIRQAQIARDRAQFMRVGDAMAGRAISDPNVAYNNALAARMASNPQAMEYARQVENAKAMRDLTSPDLINFMAHLSTSRQPMSLGEFIAAQRTAAVQPGSAEKNLSYLQAVKAGQVPGISEKDFWALQSGAGGAPSLYAGVPVQKPDGSWVSVQMSNRPGVAPIEIPLPGAPATYDPSVAQARAQAAAVGTTVGGEAGKKQVNAPKIDDTITMLAQISAPGGLLFQATGSGAGAMVDEALGFVGQATPGSIATAQLRPLVDAVLKNVPRFEGPQSDKDTQSYKEAAGDLANPGIPNEARVAAARILIDLLSRAKTQGQRIESGAAAAPAAPAGVDMVWNPETRRLEPKR